MRHNDKRYLTDSSANYSANYTAFAADDVIDIAEDLESLIEELVGDELQQDIAIWDRLDNLSAVILASGAVQRFDGPRSTASTEGKSVRKPSKTSKA